MSVKPRATSAPRPPERLPGVGVAPTRQAQLLESPLLALLLVVLVPALESRPPRLGALPSLVALGPWLAPPPVVPPLPPLASMLPAPAQIDGN